MVGTWEVGDGDERVRPSSKKLQKSFPGLLFLMLSISISKKYKNGAKMFRENIKRQLGVKKTGKLTEAYRLSRRRKLKELKVMSTE